MSRATHTYAILQVSPKTYREIREKLEAAGYQQAFHPSAEGEVIDMQGIALQAKTDDTKVRCGGCGGLFVKGRGLSVHLASSTRARIWCARHQPVNPPEGIA